MRLNSTLLMFFISICTIAQNRDASYLTGTGFSASNNYIYSSTLQTDGKLLVAGEFSIFNGTSTNNFIRLNTNGTIDTSFKTNLGTGFNYETGDVAVQTDGKIIVLIKNSSTNTTFNGTAIKKIVRLNSNGSLDNTFNYYRANLNFNPERILIQSDGKIIVGSIDGVVRVTSTGSLDNTFVSGIVTYTNIPVIRNIAIDNNNKILVIGNFLTFNGQNTKRLIRLNSDGSIDNSLNIGTGFVGNVASIAIQTDGKILVGGQMSSLNSLPITKVIRLNIDGTIDNTFNFTETIFSSVSNLKLQSNGSIIITGINSAAVAGSNILIARLSSNGQNDNSLDISSTFFGYTCSSFQIQSDGKFIFLGDFYEFNNTRVNRIIRITNPVLSTGSFEKNEIKIFPNPTTQTINLLNISNTDFEIYDMLGKLILKGTSNDTIINVNSLSKGVFILKLKNQSEIFNQKFIKE